MDNQEFVNKTRPTIEKAVSINFENWGEEVKFGHQEFDVFIYKGEPAVFLGERDMWYWVAPLSTLVAVKECDSIFDGDEMDQISAIEILEILEA